MRDVQGRLLSLWHLARRFFGFLTARALSPVEQAWVREHLPAPTARLFFAQPSEDQRHAYAVARAAGVSTGGDRSVIEAALLHDVGKSDLGLGAYRRSIATLIGALPIATPGWAHTYLDHGERGARALKAAGAGELAITFARHHPGARPADVSQAAWMALEAADG